ncbi:uncharacterized protein CEXT_617331 [Caerostris extrusa]|uniref:Ig-like domain-containing protein n=1 Tax=Caerostris extrusa TaxID=172846 RepID=A0AAV4UGW0_CAEEX|nr:uncharacterized protein CEXT_617331 [Caerostris extrusa]
MAGNKPISIGIRIPFFVLNASPKGDMQNVPFLADDKILARLITFAGGNWVISNSAEKVEMVFSLRMVMLDVPSAVNLGESVELSCIYELENDRLYSIKWYKNDVEFYRFVPNDWPPGQFLPLPGIRVDLSKSGQRSVYLRSVDLNSTGTYRCEVSAEAPSFQSVEAERDMKVMDVKNQWLIINTNFA